MAFIEPMHRNKPNITYLLTYSMSVLQAIESQQSKNPLVNRVLQTCQEILSGNKFVIFCWIPSHRDITANEDADRAAKDALSKAQPENF